MIIQIIDQKSECPSVFFDGDIHEGFPPGPLETWDYSEIFEARDDILYAKVLCGGRSLDQVCPSHLRESFSRSRTKLEAFYRSLRVTRASPAGLCLVDVIPKEIVQDYCQRKQEIIEHVIRTSGKPTNYDFLVKIVKLTSKIASQDLNLSEDLMNKYQVTGNKILYNPFGAKTGRLGTKKGSFPILNLRRNHRDVIRASSDYFLSLDYNAAEIRVFLALLDENHPMLKVDDIHDWNSKALFDGLSRDESKLKFFAWLYNPTLINRSVEIHYPDKNKLMRHFVGGQVETLFGRSIACEKFNAINNLIQSTLADLFLEQSLKIAEFLRDKKSRIAFLLHDNLVLDVAKRDQIDTDIIEMFSETRFGKFPCSVKVGPDFKNMEKFS